MPDRWQEMYAAKLESRVRVLEKALRKIDKWCNGENQVGDGEDAEDALAYIANVVRAALAPPAGTPQEKK